MFYQIKNIVRFVAIEVEKEELLNSMNDKISNSAKLQMDYDKQKI